MKQSDIFYLQILFFIVFLFCGSTGCYSSKEQRTEIADFLPRLEKSLINQELIHPTDLDSIVFYKVNDDLIPLSISQSPDIKSVPDQLVTIDRIAILQNQVYFLFHWGYCYRNFEGTNYLIYSDETKLLTITSPDLDSIYSSHAIEPIGLNGRDSCSSCNFDELYFLKENERFPKAMVDIFFHPGENSQRMGIGMIDHALVGGPER